MSTRRAPRVMSKVSPRLRTPKMRSGRKQAKIMKAKDFDTTRPLEHHGVPYFAHRELDLQHFNTDMIMSVKHLGVLPTDYGMKPMPNSDAEYEEDAVDHLDPALVKRGMKRQRNSPGVEPSSKKKIRGGRAAVAKKVTADLDSDDELIVSMKNAKYLEKDISDRLAAEGRINYNPKTIGTRWARIKRVLQQHQDTLLDADMTDWHDDDDIVLYQAIQKADRQVQKWKQEADDKKWRVVADEMHSMKPVTTFSQNACAKRFAALQEGTAKPTPESVQAPDEDTLRRIQSRRDKEARVRDDEAMNPKKANIEGNSWTSRMRKYY